MQTISAAIQSSERNALKKIHILCMSFHSVHSLEYQKGFRGLVCSSGDNQKPRQCHVICGGSEQTSSWFHLSMSWFIWPHLETCFRMKTVPLPVCYRYNATLWIQDKRNVSFMCGKWLVGHENKKINWSYVSKDGNVSTNLFLLPATDSRCYKITPGRSVSVECT